MFYFNSLWCSFFDTGEAHHENLVLILLNREVLVQILMDTGHVRIEEEVAIFVIQIEKWIWISFSISHFLFSIQSSLRWKQNSLIIETDFSKNGHLSISYIECSIYYIFYYYFIAQKVFKKLIFANKKSGSLRNSNQGPDITKSVIFNINGKTFYSTFLPRCWIII